jgi:hypothetical protein
VSSTRIALSLLLACAGCSSALTPDVGPAIAGVCKNDDTDPGLDISFHDDVLPLLTNGCSCHNPAKGGGAIPLTGFSIESYDKVMRGGAKSGEDIVVPGDPCSSVLLQKLGEAPPFGVRMPSFGPYLSKSELALIHDWIAEGAHDD